MELFPAIDLRDGKAVRLVQGDYNQMTVFSDRPEEVALGFKEQGAKNLHVVDLDGAKDAALANFDTIEKLIKTTGLFVEVGGGISTLDDFDRVLKCGADKVSVNSGAIKNPELITEAAHRYGDQCVVLSMDVKRVGDEYHVFKQGGRVDTGIDALEWAESGVRRGAGELVVNSIDTDGVKQGFDIPMLLEIVKRVDVPIIASGGAGKKEDFLDLFQYPQIDAGLAASIFHRKEVNIKELKQYLAENGVEMRLI